jgi:CheY-like chemotaxis protein
MRILVIDDDPLTIEILKKGLEGYGHQVVTGESGYKALCLLEEDRFDFVLCDVFMPEISGLIVANVLRQYDHSVPFLLMSSDRNVGTFIRQRFSPSCEFINKPISVPILMDKIDAQVRAST